MSLNYDAWTNFKHFNNVTKTIISSTSFVYSGLSAHIGPGINIIKGQALGNPIQIAIRTDPSSSGSFLISNSVVDSTSDVVTTIVSNISDIYLWVKYRSSGDNVNVYLQWLTL